MDGVKTSGIPDAKPIHRLPPKRKRMGPDGVVIEEKLNPMPRHNKIKMVAPSGQVFELSVANGWAIKQPKAQRYYHQILAEKTAAGFLVYAECPVATGRIPPGKGDDGKPDLGCRDDRGLPLRATDDQCCPHMERVIAARKRAQEQRSAQFEQAFKSQESRKLEAFEAMARQLMAQNAVNDEPAERASSLSDMRRKDRR